MLRLTKGPSMTRATNKAISRTMKKAITCLFLDIGDVLLTEITNEEAATFIDSERLSRMTQG